MAIESNFNPFAQSAVGAQGLMQVMTRVHTEKYQNFGGHFAAFDPVSNLRVGVKVLQECIARAGSIEGFALLRGRRQPARRWRIHRQGDGRAFAPAPGGQWSVCARQCSRHALHPSSCGHRRKLCQPHRAMLANAPRPKPTARWRCSVLWVPEARCCHPAGQHSIQTRDKTLTKTPGGLKAPPPGRPCRYLSYTTGVRDWR